MSIYRSHLAILILIAAPILLASPAYAHAFGQRYDLPIPLSYFMAGAAATVALSFLVIGIFLKGGSHTYRYPTLNLLAVPALGRFLSSPIPLALLRALSVLLLLLTIATSLFGTDNSIENFAPTFVWIIWWVGFGYISALFGNLWLLINPWKTLYDSAEWLLERIGKRMPTARPYPDNWDALPALLAFLAFVWLENVYPGSILPRNLAIIIIAYSIYTLGGMLIFGKLAWLRYGDPFTLLFSIFARFSPTEIRALNQCRRCELDCANDPQNQACVDCLACFQRANPQQRQLNLRPWAAGLVSVGRVSPQACAFVILALAAVTFDGLQETQNWLSVQSLGLTLLGPGGVSAVDTLGVVLIPLLFLAIYLLFCIAIQTLSREQSPISHVARAYVFSLVPIALAYNMAHFLSLLIVQGQLIIPLASDPFGFGWDIFGAAAYRIDPTLWNTKAAWIASVIAIVGGHIISVYIAHTIAIRRATSHKLALRGQYPMLALMVFYTAVSLWIIAQPIVSG